MKKYLFFVALFTVLQVNYLRAQKLFEAPDTVCPKQMVQLKSNAPDARTHYWGFCSGYLLNKPTGDKVRDTVLYTNPTGIEIAEDRGRYYGFAIYNTTRTFVKMDFGNSLNNTPKITNYGNMDGVLPEFPRSMYLVRQPDSTWHIFVAGGNSTTNSTLARIDFDKNLANTPNIVNFGTLGNKMNTPVGLFVTQEDNKWYGFVLNRKIGSEMVRLEFDSNLSFTPVAVDLGIVVDNNGDPALIMPTDMAAIKDNGLWYFFATLGPGNNVARLEMGSTLATATPLAAAFDNVVGNLNQPTGISIIRDCDSIYCFIVNQGNNNLIRMGMKTVTGPYDGDEYTNVAGLKAASALSGFVRDKDEVFVFATNVDTTLSRIKFGQCTNSSIASATTNTPPAYFYDTAGLYNVYYVVNEGYPDMQVMCHQIRVLPTPPIFLTPQDTALCEGDTIVLNAYSVNAQSYTWSPAHNISTTSSGNNVKIWPEYSVDYKLRMPFPHNCIIDTVVKVRVNKIKADAGPDRTIADGATTILGGPLTSEGPNNQYFYVWSPNQYMDNRYDKNPNVKPPFDFTYYLTVTDSANCVSIDTVVVRVNCKDINLPNAFMPNGGVNTRAHFGLANQQLAKLNHFRIYDRWGKLVFTAGDENIADPTKEWDGTVNGQDAPMGVYVWDADGFCASGQRVRKSGNVTLLR